MPKNKWFKPDFLRSGDASGAGILSSQCSSVAVNFPGSYLLLEEAVRSP